MGRARRYLECARRGVSRFAVCFWLFCRRKEIYLPFKPPTPAFAVYVRRLGVKAVLKAGAKVANGGENEFTFAPFKMRRYYARCAAKSVLPLPVFFRLRGA
ncbi:hypothetical protein NPIL_519531 [Nephila pilipes]|uniref:Uncharacterized protein n=1 Tax=Nephila pilipes TaxID=299642 RepID=A0A8X6PS30_NEPPI|nr:hypothetical protein NPIL_519531 [Nephila pilipes]